MCRRRARLRILARSRGPEVRATYGAELQNPHAFRRLGRVRRTLAKCQFGEAEGRFSALTVNSAITGGATPTQPLRRLLFPLGG